MKDLNYKVRHGEAVSVGLLMAARLSILLGMANLKIYNINKNHQKKLKLPITLKCLSKNKKWNEKSLIRNMLLDKKKTNENIRFILLNDIGKALIKNNVCKNKLNLIIREFVDV